MAGERDINLKIALEVEKYPCLYNFKLSEYSRKDLTEKAWNEVSKATNVAVHDCKEKWKNVRSAFVRSLKPAPSGSSARTKKPYYLHDYMLFILPYVKPTQTTESPGNIERPEQLLESEVLPIDENEDNVIADEASSTLRAPWNEEPQPANTSTISTSQPPTTARRKRKAIDLDQQFLQYLNSKKKNTTTTDDDTSNRYFLLSLLPEMRGLNVDQLRRFKIKVIMLLESCKENSTVESSPSYTPIPTPSPHSSVSTSEPSYTILSRPESHSSLESYHHATEVYSKNIPTTTYPSSYSPISVGSYSPISVGSPYTGKNSTSLHYTSDQYESEALSNQETNSITDFV